jgi:hypothetical protein
MLSKVILFTSILSYSVVVSQSFMYILALKNTQLALGGSSYTEVRQLIDANMMTYFKYVVYVVLLANLLLVVVNFGTPMSLSFVTALIAFIALIVDTTLTLKGNVPLNHIINAWSPENYPASWKEIRQQWLVVFQYRQIVNILGFLSLLAGAVFGQK